MKIISIILFLPLLSCTNKEKNKEIYIEKNTSIQNNLIKLEKDSIIFLKSSSLPNLNIIRAIKNKDARLLKKFLGDRVVLSDEYEFTEDLFKDCHLYDSVSSTQFWDFLYSYLSLKGGYINDSIYIIPLYNFLNFSEQYPNNEVLISIKESTLYKDKSIISKQIISIPKNHIVKKIEAFYDDTDTISCVNNVFNKNSWYKVIYKDDIGFVNGSEFYDPYLYTIFFSKEKGVWKLTDISPFD